MRLFFDGVKYFEKFIYVSPKILRKISCNCCGACCCHSYSMDYLPNENKPANVFSREVHGKMIYTLENTGGKRDEK